MFNNSKDDTQIIHFHSIDSTNTYLMSKAKSENLRNLTVVIADEQSGGRGRLGKSFESKCASGLYMSVYLNEIQLLDPAAITVISAICASESIEEISGKNTFIKWVNDVYIDEKKVCGILTEGAYENGKLKYAVIGFGVNIAEPKCGFSDSIKSIAGAVLDEYSDILRDKLAALILNKLVKAINEYDRLHIYQKYKSRLCVIGKEVTVISGNISYTAIVKNLNNDYSLVVTDSQGNDHILNSGEISLKLK